MLVLATIQYLCSQFVELNIDFISGLVVKQKLLCTYVKVVALHCHIVWPLNVPTFLAVFGLLVQTQQAASSFTIGNWNLNRSICVEKWIISLMNLLGKMVKWTESSWIIGLFWFAIIAW